MSNVQNNNVDFEDWHCPITFEPMVDAVMLPGCTHRFSQVGLEDLVITTHGFNPETLKTKVAVGQTFLETQEMVTFLQKNVVPCPSCNRRITQFQVDYDLRKIIQRVEALKLNQQEQPKAPEQIALKLNQQQPPQAPAPIALKKEPANDLSILLNPELSLMIVDGLSEISRKSVIRQPKWNSIGVEIATSKGQRFSPKNFQNDDFSLKYEDFVTWLSTEGCSLDNFLKLLEKEWLYGVSQAIRKELGLPLLRTEFDIFLEFQDVFNPDLFNELSIHLSDTCPRSVDALQREVWLKIGQRISTNRLQKNLVKTLFLEKKKGDDVFNSQFLVYWMIEVNYTMKEFLAELHDAGKFYVANNIKEMCTADYAKAPASLRENPSPQPQIGKQSSSSPVNNKMQPNVNYGVNYGVHHPEPKAAQPPKFPEYDPLQFDPPPKVPASLRENPSPQPQIGKQSSSFQVNTPMQPRVNYGVNPQAVRPGALEALPFGAIFSDGHYRSPLIPRKVGEELMRLLHIFDGATQTTLWEKIGLRFYKRLSEETGEYKSFHKHVFQEEYRGFKMLDFLNQLSREGYSLGDFFIDLDDFGYGGELQPIIEQLSKSK